MKITQISCTQFAGARDRSVSFTDGINVIYGKNESGKSTLVNLISRTLFQDAKMDGRSDKSFRKSFFPAEKKNSAFVSDFVDGKITFETENGRYTLTKEWGNEPRTLLSTPDGIIKDSDSIANFLKEILVYGEGVYKSMLLSSQNNTDEVLRNLLGQQTKNDPTSEIADAVSKAFSESDGISVDAIEQAIREKKGMIAGKHWDFERGAPVRRADRWAAGLGDIHKAYYAMEDAANVLKEVSRLEYEADKASAEYTMADANARKAEEDHNRFNSYAGKLEAQSERKKSISRMEDDLRKISDVLSKWPTLADNIERAKALKKELDDRNAIDVYNSVKELYVEYKSLNNKVGDMLCPEESEITAFDEAQRRIFSLENKLCGMNLNAAIKMFDGNSVSIRSLVTDKEIAVGDIVNITEAVSITIPGVMEMQLSPKNVDVTDIERKLSKLRSENAAVLEKYGVSSLRDLKKLREEYLDVKNRISDINAKLSRVIDGKSIDEIKTAATSVAEMPRSKDEISKDIYSLCGSVDVSRYVVSGETYIDSYKNEYNSIAELKAKAYDMRAELDEKKASVSDVEDIPNEYKGISDPEAYRKSLETDFKNKQHKKENALKEKTAAATTLERYKESISGDPKADAESAKRAFDEQKKLLDHWTHIEKVFKMQREKVDDNPLIDLARNFTHYLEIITGGKVASEFPDADKMDMKIYSSDRLVDYDKLSEGTKETVSLAFRSAVIDHLFPDGGGVAVFDDPFANMDAERTARSAELIKDLAKRHQVIFLTCKEEYADLMQGNSITL